MENFDYWVSLYSWIFTILIASLSVNSIFFIKGFLNKLLYFFIFTRLYAFILTFFFESASIGYTQQELLPMFIYKRL